ncbi:MazG nucleotide pyrophosphohydrolase domain protein [Prevotella sp. DNF00663]|uniref:nucleoside triphosphate pyrophosphohydrolase family protein n=1 Tax=unclassified Prevotella TaxID=2638335 RepID=UPI000512AEC6|nr:MULTISPECIES: nucleoside triphosphate pyrophosphohydrolase family protein [unclassified Prevotella]KGI60746.1 hypothetical protein HMPREF0671_04205 [Prevotella sp. S7 MS 2]KXB78644.1 MazG nucleotide pyrophosphohydrolase domain protein [Prevotella sp. DNF00663]
MELNDYQEAALKTAIYPEDMGIVYPALGLSGETGEVADKIKKCIRDNDGVFDEAERKAVAKEMGDVLWYLAALSRDIDISLEEIARMNLEKVMSRQLRGKLHGQGDER